MKFSNLRKSRKRADLTLQDVADELGYSVSGYSKIESGVTNLLAEDAMKLSKLFGVTVDELLTEEKPKPTIQDVPNVILIGDVKKNTPEGARFLERLNDLLRGE